jgi:hypothetical protein
MSTGNLKKSSYSSFDISQIRGDNTSLILLQNGPLVVNYNSGGVTMTLTYYYYTWGNVKIVIIKMTNITTGGSPSYTVTLAYNVNFNNCSVLVGGISTDSGSFIVIPNSTTNLGTGVSFKLVGTLGGSGVVVKGCVVAIGI